MNPTFHRERLAVGANGVAALVANLSAEAAAQRVQPDKWSAVEILCHLRDEEREDFRVRLDYTLHRPGETWPSIDPPGWVAERNYQTADIRRVTAEFLAERRDSLVWLAELAAPDWSAAYEHPALGRIRAGDLLASWAAHDLLHLRQLSGLIFAQVGAAAQPYGTAYAGPW